MKKKKLLKAIITLLIILLQIIGIILLSYSLILYSGVETFYRIYIIILLIYFALFMSYLLLRSIKSKKKKAFIIPLIISLILIIIEFIGYYYLTNVYKAIDSYSKKDNKYFTSLVTYNKELTKDLKNKNIGIVNDTTDIEGNVLPLEIIEKNNYKNNNKIIEYDSTIELLYSLKNKKIDAAFFSSNYIDMFYSLEGFENIEEETKVLLEESKVYEAKEIEEKTTSSLTKPFTMLFIGVDSSKDGITSGYNADVLILVTFNPKTLRATMTSVPRDTYIKTACSNGNYRRINTTTWGSTSDCAVKTMENLFGVSIDYYAKINFKGIVQLVDALGGIDVDVTYSLCDQNSSRKWGNKKTVYVEKGKQHLNGEQALAVARNRHKPNDGSKVGAQMNKYCPTYTEGNRSDYTRGKNQMKIILGIVNAATKLRDPNQALDILEKISKNFQTNVKAKDVTALYNLGKSIILTDSSNLVNVQRTQLNGYTGDIYEPASNSYPSVQIPYNESINDIKKEININLGKTKATPIKTITFDLNKPFEDEVIGNKSYSQSKIATLANVSSYSVEKVKKYASSNNLKLKFIDIDTKQEISLDSYTNYKFYSQKEHVKTIIDQLSTLTIYVKKQVIETPQESEITE